MQSRLNRLNFHQKVLSGIDSTLMKHKLKRLKLSLTAFSTKGRKKLCVSIGSALKSGPLSTDLSVGISCKINDGKH